MSTEHRHWTWAEDCLRDEEGTVWATVRADVLNVNESQLAAAQERILLEHSIDSGSRHFWVRGTATTGETLHVGQQGVLEVELRLRAGLDVVDPLLEAGRPAAVQVLAGGPTAMRLARAGGRNGRGLLLLPAEVAR